MPVKSYRPTTPTRRFATSVSREDITAEKPHKSLLEPLRKKGGRNNVGQIAVRHHGGGHKQQYRRIDFLRDKHGIPARVASRDRCVPQTEVNGGQQPVGVSPLLLDAMQPR